MSLSGKQEYTVQDILELPEGERAELIDGEIFFMASPTTTHQEIAGWIYAEIRNYIKEKNGKCRVFISPFAVFLKNDDKNYVEPDVCVICDREKLDNQGCHGAPDWMVEVVSSSSRRMDYYRKLSAYQEAGVREYWLVDSLKKTIVVYNLEQEEMPVVHPFGATVKVGIYEDFAIDFSQMTDYDFK
ncbi:MAG: Uma2 family endonuclease [Lachnospiraceae bacterium]|nr:Uma2 family endonuclease [Lachnospiraceae bacterium]